jgi:RHS repeat-associated protein
MRTLLLISLVVITGNVLAVKDGNVMPFIAGWFKPSTGTVYDTIRHTSYLAAIADSATGNFRSDKPGVRQSVTTISLLISSDVPCATGYDVTLKGFCKKISQTGARDSVPFTLQVNYNPGAGTNYKQRDAISINNSVHALVVATITVNGTTITDTADNRFRVEVSTIGDLVYPPPSNLSLTESAPIFNIINEDATARNIKWSWAPLPWAEYYELEYLHVDDYKADGTRKERSSLRYNFRTDAVRVRVNTNEYELPLVFEQGYLVARVRAVGFKGRDFSIPVYGNWNLNDEGTIPATGNSVFEIPAAKAHEADRLNWQYVAGFNESGLRSEAVTYADGTLRARQQVTALPEENKLLVTETFYDHQGRPAIITLPAPIKPSATTFTPPPPYNVGGPTGIAPSTITLPKGTTNQFQNIGGPVNLSGTNFSNTLNTGFSLPTGFSPTAINNLQQYLGNFELNNYLGLFWYQSQNARIGFVPRFNVNQEGRNILRNQYDVGKACDSASVAFGTQSGAGRYYSPANPEQSRWQAYVPDAEGYPYAQVKYSNDGTGKIRESSKPGFAFRMGGGRTQKYFYGTPSQAELDRYFGNDAGRSSFYKKTLMIDENGQAHVSIHNLKGNVVLSAMAGAKPENLEAISGVTTVNDTIDLIAENNVLNTSENAWISTKRIVLAASTDVQLSYRTSTPDYAGRYCNSTPFCFDCIYDLEIIVTDGCGNTRYEHRQTIGNLENISTCSNFEATPATTIRLDQGNYTIIKKLKVNEASIEAYVNQFTERFTCRADTLLFTPDVDAACNPDCITCNVENVTAGFLRREGGSANISYIKRKSGNNSACQLACTQTGLGEVAMAFQTMLSEVSPGGQYAEYRDTTDEALRPTGIIDPSKFPLSVLNDANQLPLRNATWRTPAFNYQTKTGETAYVEIDAEGLPAHRSPASEIVRRDGKQFVLVKYLNDVSEFIRLWEPQWAEALVVYHPEYEYYQWCVRNSASFRFDSLMVATEKYSDAAAQHLTDFRNDPLFPASSATLRADMEMRLANFSSIAGTPVSAAQMAILSVHCGNPNFTDAQLRDCYSSKTLYATPGAQDKEWLVYKGLYRKTKLRVLSNERNRFVTAAGGFNNRTIGGTRDVAANSLYAGKRRVFKEEDDVNDELELDFAGEEPTLTEVQELYNRITKQRYADCGICPIGSDLVMLLNALSYDKKLTAANVTLPGLSPLVLTKNIVNSFSNNTALQYSWSRINDPNPNILKAKITTGGVDMGTLTLQKRKADIVWDSLFILDCFKPTGNYTFTLRIIDNNGKADTVQGISNCFRLNDCTFNRSCTATPARKEMLTFLQYLFEANRYRRSALTVHTAASNSPFFGLALRAIHPRGQTWEWAFGGFTSTANTSFNAQLRISEGRGALTASPAICEFAFRVITPGFSFDSLGFIIAVRKPASLPSSALVNDAELMVRSKGGRVFYIAMSNSCYSLFNCPGNLTNATLRPAMCCSPTPRMGPVPNNCEASLRLIARREVERDFETRKAMAVDSMRSAYIRHCLNSVQEKLTVAYNDAMYMATLYYYDLSGALVKTVPPKGVRTLTNAQIVACRNHRDNSSRPAVYPSHVLATTYSYTSFGAVAEKTSPDEGTVKYAYDFAGRTILSRNAEQAANNYASYIRYDANNRIIESGRTNYSGTWQTFKDYSAHTGTLSGLAEVTQTNYDEPSALASYFSLGGGQKRLRNRPSSVSYKMNGSTDAYVAAYSYDALGNVTRMVQHYPALGLSGANAVKTVDYNFDKLSGQITRIVYQQGKEDQFIHWLSYDANKRVTQVHTSKSEYIPERLRDADATFYYYQHGPLARIEIGNEKIQGVDYAYTIQGWLKGINSYTTGNGNLDMGKDGTEEGSLHAAGFPKDVTAELLNYFPNDYKKIGAEGAPFYPESPLSVLNSGFSKPLYNGNIQNSMMSVLHGFSGDAYKTFAQAYSYDQANRIRQSKMLFATESGFESAFSEQYKMSVDYDLNGNITSLTRSGNSATLFDNLTYKYNQPEQNNRLHQITDIGSSGAADLKNQTNTNNYGYDAIGRLVSDISEGISNIQYNNQSKVTAVNKAGNNTTYAYDAFGRRISKTVNGATEWYVNDALGNPMAIYSINGSEVRWKEATIYGGKRMGVYKHDVQLAVPGITHNVMRDSLIRGNKRYELANHIGDVLAVVSDRKVSTPDGFAAEVQAAHNYYPFGMTMPGRTFGNDEYRYGFQGMESEDNLRGENNSYTTEFRQYDPRVGRWMSVDPKADKYANLSPYNALFNNPISITDPLGNDPPVKKTFEQSMNELPTTGTGPDDPIAMGEDLSFLDGDKEVSERPRHRRHPTVRTPETPSTFSFPEPAGDLLAGAPIAVYDFEDDHVHGRRSTGSSTSPSTTPPPPGEDWERDVRIVREALGNAGTVMDVGGVVSDGVSIYEMTREGLSIREGADVLMRGSRTVGGMSLLGAGISTANMVGDIWDDANALVDGDIGTGTYVGRSALNITSGVVGCVPVVGVVGSRALGAFRDWALPRPAH